jgi:long-chain fatty acid transport protein
MNIKRGYVVVPIVSLALFMSPAYATNGMRLIGFGPVQRAMGGIGVGVTLDAASVLTNPAGMSELPQRIDFGATYFSPSVDYNATGAMPGMIIKNDGVTIHSDRGASPVPAFGLILDISDDFKFGLGAYGISGMGVDYPENLYFGTTYTSYSQMRFAPGVSYRIMKGLSVGAVLNVMYATMEFDAAYTMGQRAHMGASSFGIGGTLGVKYSPFDMISIGAAFEIMSFFQDFRFNVNGTSVPDPMGGDPTPFNSGVDKIKFNQPSVATIGLSAKPIEGLTVGMDFELILWSETNGKKLPKYTQSQPYTQPWNMSWSNQFVLKAGVQYQIIPMLAVRAGYNWGKMPLSPSRAFENIAFPAVAEHHITFGAGVKLGERFEINLGAMISPRANISGSNQDFPPPYGNGQAIASYKTGMSQYSLELGIAYML